MVNTAGIPHDWVDYEPPLDRVLELAGYGELRAKQSEQGDRGGLLGVGICSYVDATGLGSSPLLSLTNYQWSDTSPWTTAETCSTRCWWRARCEAGSRRGGAGLVEEVTYTADGQPEATSLLSYLVPSRADLPASTWIEP